MGRENRLATIGTASAAPGRARLRSHVAIIVTRPRRFRHGFVRSRHALIPTASALMTGRARRRGQFGSERRREHETGKCNRARSRSFSSDPRARPPSRSTVERGGSAILSRNNGARRSPSGERLATPSLPQRGSQRPGPALGCAFAPSVSVSADLCAVASRNRARTSDYPTTILCFASSTSRSRFPEAGNRKRCGSPRRPRPVRSTTPPADRRANAS